MSEKYNSTCSICGKPYKVCKSCQNMQSFVSWRQLTDTLEHYKIFTVLSEYDKTKDKQKAKDGLSACDLSDVSELKSYIQDMINEILKEEITETVVEEIKDDTAISETENIDAINKEVEEITKEVKEEKPQRYYKKNRYYKNEDKNIE